MMKLTIIFKFALVTLISGCATVKNVHNEPAEPVPVVKAPESLDKREPASEATAEPVEQIEDSTHLKFSDLNNWAPASDRNYKRMTRQRMEEESDLGSEAGSLWKMSGQTSYLFAENKHRQSGDQTAIKVEGSAIKVIENKVVVIQDLLKRLDEQKKQAEEDVKKAQEEKQKLALIEEEKKLMAEKIAKGEILVDPMASTYAPEPVRQPAASEKTKNEAAKPAAKPETSAAAADKEEKVDLKEIESIPCQIVEKTPEGLYRIRGQQFLTIKKKPYRVIATALVRPEDYNDSSVSSNKLLEPQYDVLHVKRTTE